MKKNVVLIITVLLTLALLISFLVGCADKHFDNKYNTDQEKSNMLNYKIQDSLAFSAYMAGDLLNFQNASAMLSPLNSAEQMQSQRDSDILDIETELEQVNVYFNKLKMFMDKGVDNTFIFTETTSDKVEYDNMIKFEVSGTEYKVYYNLMGIQQNTEEIPNIQQTQVDLGDNIYKEDEFYDEEETEQEFQLVGIVVINDVEYDLKGANETEDNEQKLWIETINEESADNFIRIERKIEEDEQKYECKVVRNGVINEREIKFENENNQTKIELKLISGDEENQYEFKKQTESQGVVYKFEYRIDQTIGQVEIYETKDQYDKPVYRYKIEEKGKNKEIDKDKLFES